MSKFLVVLSGGQDSTTCLFWAKQQIAQDKEGELHCITFAYGQRHSAEIDAARKVATMANATSHEVVEVPNCLKSTSPLTSSNKLERYESFEQMDAIIGDRIEKTFVPMRNSLFLVIAANRAIALGCDVIVTGVCQEDNANYPDCRASFISRMQDAINSSLGGGIADLLIISTPLMWRSKAETVLLAADLPGCMDALAYTHTSYDGKYPPTDMNHANVLRAKGFEDAGVADPLVVRAYHEGMMELPATKNYDAFRQAEL